MDVTRGRKDVTNSWKNIKRGSKDLTNEWKDPTKD